MSPSMPLQKQILVMAGIKQRFIAALRKSTTPRWPIPRFECKRMLGINFIKAHHLDHTSKRTAWVAASLSKAMQNTGIAQGDPNIGFMKVEVSFQQFYSFIAAIPCSSYLKFWLAYEWICKCASNGNCVLSRALYNDFLRPYAPFKVMVDKTIVYLIRSQLERTDFSQSLTQLLRTAQTEIGNLLGSGNYDMTFMFNLIMNYILLEGSRYQIQPVRMAHHDVRASETASYVTNKPAQPQPCQLDHKQLYSQAVTVTNLRCIPTEVKQPRFLKLEKPALSKETFFQKVHSCLINLQKERDTMLMKAKEEANEKGEPSGKIEWYDFSDCPKNTSS